MEFYKNTALVKVDEKTYQLVVKVTDRKEERITLDARQLEFLLTQYREFK
jgi:hypothetical protein